MLELVSSRDLISKLKESFGLSSKTAGASMFMFVNNE